VPLCPQKIPHGLPWVRTWVSMVRSQWLTAWAMAWPPNHYIDWAIPAPLLILSMLKKFIW
jgi:hypothetical protein